MFFLHSRLTPFMRCLTDSFTRKVAVVSQRAALRVLPRLLTIFACLLLLSLPSQALADSPSSLFPPSLSPPNISPVIFSSASQGATSATAEQLLAPLLNIPYRADGAVTQAGVYTTFADPHKRFTSPGLNCSGFVLAAARLLFRSSLSVEAAGFDRWNDSGPDSPLGHDWDYGWDLLCNLVDNFASDSSHNSAFAHGENSKVRFLVPSTSSDSTRNAVLHSAQDRDGKQDSPHIRLQNGLQGGLQNGIQGGPHRQPLSLGEAEHKTLNKTGYKTGHDTEHDTGHHTFADPLQLDGAAARGYDLHAKGQLEEALARMRPDHVYLLSFNKTKSATTHAPQHYHVALMFLNARNEPLLYQTTTQRKKSYVRNLATPRERSAFLKAFANTRHSRKHMAIIEIPMR